MPRRYKKLSGLLSTLAVVLLSRFGQAQPAAEVPVLLTKTVTVVDFKPPRLRIDISGDASDYYAQIEITDSTLIFSSPAELEAFEKQRPKLERDYERSRKAKIPGKQPPYLQPYLDGRNLLRPGIEVSVSFLEYQYSRRFVMQSLTILTDQLDDGGLSGQLEQVSGEVGLVNGYRVRLKPGVELVGSKGYQSRTFSGFNRLEEGVNVAVQGKRQADGVLLAESATVTPDEPTALDQQLIQTLKTTRKLSADGTLVTFGTTAYRLLTSDTITSYLTGVVTKLLPDRFRNLPTDHPASLNVRVYVLVDSTANACVYPDGSVYLHTGLLSLIDNEAQLAAILSRELAHVTFHHPRRAYQEAPAAATSGTALSPTIVAAYGLEPAELATYLAAFGGGPLSSTYKQEFESQADRVAIKHMMLAGYDPRELTKIWLTLFQKSPDVPSVPFVRRTPNKGTRLFESPYETHGLAGRRYKYVSSLLLSEYQATDLNKFGTGGTDYKAIREQMNTLLMPPVLVQEEVPIPAAPAAPRYRSRYRPKAVEPQGAATPARTTRRPRPVTSGPVKKTGL